MRTISLEIPANSKLLYKLNNFSKDFLDGGNKKRVFDFVANFLLAKQNESTVDCFIEETTQENGRTLVFNYSQSKKILICEKFTYEYTQNVKRIKLISDFENPLSIKNHTIFFDRILQDDMFDMLEMITKFFMENV